MKRLPRYPSLFQVNTRVRLSELAATLGRRATLDDITDAEVEALARDGFDVVWMLGVWQTGEAGRAVSRNPQWNEEYRRTLPDLTPADVVGSCFAVRDYHVHGDFGGDEALARLRERLRRHGLRLVLDFVPNHVAPDHPWVSEHPDFFIEGTTERLAREPQNYRYVDVDGDNRILAYGRDPYFAGWSDTLQLNYGNPALQDALMAELARIATQCDGLRCDMAMLVLPDVFERTWGITSAPFWPRAIPTVRAENPQFLFMAEVYWDLEWTLQQQGFDYTYDKRLYDRLAHRETRAVRDHFRAGLDFQDRLVRFLENHDEPRAAATFTPDVHRAAAVITFLCPGMRFVHMGEREGRKVRISMHLGRGPREAMDPEIAAFYTTLLAVVRDAVVRDGAWQLLDVREAWSGNPTHEAFIAFAWTTSEARRLVVVNYAPHQGQCYLGLPWSDLPEKTWRLRDALGDAVYVRDGVELARSGLYVDMPAWAYHVFDVDQSVARTGTGTPVITTS